MKIYQEIQRKPLDEKMADALLQAAQEAISRDSNLAACMIVGKVYEGNTQIAYAYHPLGDAPAKTLSFIGSVSTPKNDGGFLTKVRALRPAGNMHPTLCFVRGGKPGESLVWTHSRLNKPAAGSTQSNHRIVLPGYTAPVQVRVE